AGAAKGHRRAVAGQRPADRPDRRRERRPAAAHPHPPAQAGDRPAGAHEAPRSRPARRSRRVSAGAVGRHGTPGRAGTCAGAGPAADDLRRTADRAGSDRLGRGDGAGAPPQRQPWPDQHRGDPPRPRDASGGRPRDRDRERRDRILRHARRAAGQHRSAGAAVPGRPARRADPLRRRPPRCHAIPDGSRLMPLVAATRSVGRAGLFTLSVIRASRPGADLFREFVREIYKIGARSLPIIAVGGAFVGLSITLLGYRALDTYGASSQISALVGLGLYRELAPVLTALLFIGRAGSSIAAELGLMRATDQITALGLMAIDPVGKAVA